MIGQRDSKFYSELKQLNEDLVNYLRSCHEKSPFFNFTPSINDYIKQFSDLDKQYPLGGGSNSNITTTSSSSNNNNNVKSTGDGPSPPKKTPSSSLSANQNSMSAFSSAAPFVPSFIPQLTTNTTSLTSSSFLSNTTNTTSLSSQQPPPTMQPFLFGAPPAPTSALSQTNMGGLSSLSNSTTTTSTPQSFFSFTLPPKRDEDNTDTSGAGNNKSATIATAAADQEEDTPPEPKIDKYEEPNAKHSARCKLYEKAKTAGAGGEINVNLLGVGTVYVKALDTPSKLQVIVRQEPDFRRVLLNEVITSNIPVKLLPKAIQILVPGLDGEIKHLILKVKDEAEANTLYEMLNLAKN